MTVNTLVLLIVFSYISSFEAGIANAISSFKRLKNATVFFEK